MLEGQPARVRFVAFFWLSFLCSDIRKSRDNNSLVFHLPTRWATVQGKTKERWLELCERATVEQDTQKLMALIAEINQLLEEKEQRLKKMYEENSSA